MESDPGDNRLSRDYSDYLAGKRELTRNEIEQVGFRLAKELGHKTVYGVDADGEFPYPRSSSTPNQPATRRSSKR